MKCYGDFIYIAVKMPQTVAANDATHEFGRVALRVASVCEGKSHTKVCVRNATAASYPNGLSAQTHGCVADAVCGPFAANYRLRYLVKPRIERIF